MHAVSGEGVSHTGQYLKECIKISPKGVQALQCVGVVALPPAVASCDYSLCPTPDIHVYILFS